MTKVRRGYKHWLGNTTLPEPTTEAELKDLFCQARAGNLLARRRIILGHVRYVLAIVGEFVYIAENKTDDMVSAAFESLVKSVNKIAVGQIDHHDEPNVTGYINTCVKGALKRFLSEDKLIGASHHIEAKMYNAGEMPVVISKDLGAIVCRMPLSALEIEEVIARITTNEQERQVMELRLEGNNNREIGELIGKTSERVRQIRKVIGQRFLERFNEC